MADNVAVILSAMIGLCVSVMLVFAATVIVQRLIDRRHHAGRPAALRTGIAELIRKR
jgi:uncharacterized membrane protein YhaH (DUF805 family)